MNGRATAKSLVGVLGLFVVIALLGSGIYFVIREGAWWGWLMISVSVVLATALIVLLPDPLVQADTPAHKRLDPVQYVTARSENRAMIVKAIGGVLLLATLFFTWQQQQQQQQTTNKTLQATDERLRLDRDVQNANRFSDALSMLGAKDATTDARVGAIILLERLVQDSGTDLQKYKYDVVRVLTAFLRDNAKVKRPTTPAPDKPTTPTDIQTAIQVLGRNHWAPDYGYDLRGVNLSGADLHGSDFAGSNLVATDLSWANLSDVNLSGADLSRAELRGKTILTGADLSGAKLYASHSESVDFSGVKSETLKIDQLEQSLMNRDTKVPNDLAEGVQHFWDPPSIEPPPPTVSISQPSDGATVPQQPDAVIGTVDDIPQDSQLWLVTHLPGSAYYPQGNTVSNVYRTGVKVTDGQWSVKREDNAFYLGGLPSDKGKKFEILVVITDQEADRSFREYLKLGALDQDFSGFTRLPAGARVYSKVTVVRQ